MWRAFLPGSSFNISLTLTHSWFPLYLWPCSQFIYQWCQYLSKPSQISNNTIKIELAKFTIWLFITAFQVTVILLWSFFHIFWFQKTCPVVLWFCFLMALIVDYNLINMMEEKRGYDYRWSRIPLHVLYLCSEDRGQICEPQATGHSWTCLQRVGSCLTQLRTLIQEIKQ